MQIDQFNVAIRAVCDVRDFVDENPRPFGAVGALRTYKVCDSNVLWDDGVRAVSCDNAMAIAVRRARANASAWNVHEDGVSSLLELKVWAEDDETDTVSATIDLLA